MESSYSRFPDSCCCICENRLINKCKLPCRHEICFTCLQDMVAVPKRRNNLPCPMCRAVFTVTNPGPLEQSTCIKEKYRDKVERSPDCGPLRHSSKVMGMAILQDKLYVVCKKPPNTIFQHDIGIEDKISEFSNELTIEDMKWPRGMAANDSLNCLYITDWKDMFGGRLWRYDIRNRSQPFTATGIDVQPFGVSYSARSDKILVTCATPVNVAVRRGWIYVYRDLVSRLEHLQTLKLDNLQIPRHAVLTFSDMYLACHGWTIAKHGVTAFQQSVTREITSKAFYGSALGGGGGELEMNRPLSMTVDDDGLILVVDYNNHRIQLLTGDLVLVRHLVARAEHEIEYPRHVCVHSNTRRLFVGLEDGNVHVFDALLSTGS